MNKVSQGAARCAALLLLLSLAVSCGSAYKARVLRRDAPAADISLAGSRRSSADTSDIMVMEQQDTLVVYDINGRELIFAEAVEDKATGDMIANYTLSAVVVTARTRNVAERHGEVDLAFDVKVPRQMIEKEWQTRFYPTLSMMGEETPLDMVILTGPDYRRAQLRGYQRYNRFIAGIVSDTTTFINIDALEKFLERNIPQVYAYRSDSSEVSEEEFESCFGVTEREAIEHYTDKLARYFNNRRISRKDAMYRRFVKAPIVTQGVRLDTVFQTVDGDFVYEYVQTIKTRNGLRKAEITLSGEIYEQDMLVYEIPQCEPLTFFISSISAFTDNRERYLTKVISRRAEANAEYRIAFAAGHYDVDPSLEDNAREITRVRSNLRSVMFNQEFDLDSVAVSAYASPEGGEAANRALCSMRARSAADYFRPYMRHITDSLRSETELVVVAGDDYHAGGMQEVHTSTWQDIDFRVTVGGENWDLLDRLVQSDTLLDDSQVEVYLAHGDERDQDAREAAMMKDRSYQYIRRELYPRLRTVNFNFYLHRKGMVKDTVHTTELDTVYMDGVQAIRDRDYKTACMLLAPYADFNTAVAYLADDRNISALEILEPMERTAVVNYMLAILYSRLGDEQRAVQCYILACGQERTYVNRGNLDPEISALIKKYNLNKEDEDDW